MNSQEDLSCWNELFTFNYGEFSWGRGWLTLKFQSQISVAIHHMQSYAL